MQSPRDFIPKDELIALRVILARNGFAAAASHLKVFDVRNIRELIHAWEQYPKSMEHYPQRLPRRRY